MKMRLREDLLVYDIVAGLLDWNLLITLDIF